MDVVETAVQVATTASTINWVEVTEQLASTAVSLCVLLATAMGFMKAADLAGFAFSASKKTTLNLTSIHSALPTKLLTRN